MPYLFRPPVVMEAQPGAGPLFGRIRTPRGVSVLVTGTSVVEKRWPTIEEIEAADVCYMGGHEYVITNASAQVLIDAGYADGIEATDKYLDVYEERY